jgi:hypothetical protein
MKVNAMVIGFVAAFALLQTALVVSAGAAGDATTPAQEVRRGFVSCEKSMFRVESRQCPPWRPLLQRR